LGGGLQEGEGGGRGGMRKGGININLFRTRRNRIPENEWSKINRLRLNKRKERAQKARENKVTDGETRKENNRQNHSVGI